MSEVLEVHRWENNSDLIQAVFKMHVWPKRWASDRSAIQVMDVTYGRGLWWTRVDFTNLPEDDESMDVITFDPDYVAPGGRDTSTIPEFNDRYGLNDPYESPASLQAHINTGLTECARVIRPQGLILMKCATYVSSGKPWLGEYHSINHGLGLGLKVDDIFVHLSGTGPQPKRESSQQHARSNSSRLIVFRKPGRRKKT